MAKETYYNLEVETMFANAQASKKPVLEALSDAIITVLTELDALRAALGAVEWVEDSEPDLGKYCPWCGNFEKSGHAPDCQRQAALNPAEGE